MTLIIPHVANRIFWRKALLFLAVICCSACSLVKQVKILHVLNAGDIANKRFADSIAYKKSFGLIVLKGQVPEHNTSLEFVFDTGAFCTVSNTVVDSLDLKIVAQTVSGDANKTKGVVGVYRLPNFFVNNLHFRKTGAVGYDHPPVIDCIANGGILGSPMIGKAVWHIDLRKKKIFVTDDVRRIKHGPATRKLKITTDKFSRPYVTVNIESVLVKFLFDLGANSLISLPEKKRNNFNWPVPHTWLDKVL